MQLVVIGGVAGGMSAAARARRLNETATIIVLEKGPFVSFANCGLPYHLRGDIQRREALILHTPQSLAAQLNLDVRPNSEAVAIDTDAHQVTVNGPDGTYSLEYDALIVAPGATPLNPPIPGIDHPSVHRLYTIPQLDEVMAAAGNAKTATVVGAGFIGLEAVEALVKRGLSVNLVEGASHVLPPLDDTLAPILQRELVSQGVDLHIGQNLASISDDDGQAVLTLADGSTITSDLVLLSIGVRPKTELAKSAGIELDDRGAIVVDALMHTSAPDVWAVGDAVALRQQVGDTEITGFVPLAAPANRHGRLAADAIMRGRTTDDPRPPKVLGTAIVRVFEQVAAVTGASRAMLERACQEFVTVEIHPGSHAGYYPGAESIHLIGWFSPDGTLLGAQAVGKDGVADRINSLATAIKGGLTADDLADLDLAYAPPFGSAKDPVNFLGFTAQNILDDTMPVWYSSDLDKARKEGLILDVRSRREFAAGHIPEALNVPHTMLRQYISEVANVAAGRPIYVHCASGVRSYLATRILRGHGLEAYNLSGGMITMNNTLAN